MTTRSSRFSERLKQYSRSPRWARRRSNSSSSLSFFRFAGRKRCKRHAGAQIMEATDKGAAESSQADRIAVDRRHKLPGAVCFEPHVRAEPGAENRAAESAIAFLRERASEAHSSMRMNGIEIGFRQRPVAKAKLLRHIIKSARSRSGDRNAAIPER